MKFEVLFENEQFLAIAKPSGMLSVPDRIQSEPSLKDFLKQQYPEIYTVHRLDRATSGLIVFAKDPVTHKILSGLFEGRKVEKYYLGIVKGNIVPPSGVIETGIMEHPAKNGTMVAHTKGKISKTSYETLENFKQYALVKFQIFTGRTHQIRIHAQYLGHPIVADPLYGDGKALLVSSLKKNFQLSKKDFEERPIMPRLALHAHQISFSLNDQSYNLEASLPKDMQATLQQLRKHSLRPQ